MMTRKDKDNSWLEFIDEEVMMTFPCSKQAVRISCMVCVCELRLIGKLVFNS
jgi:hypothetical protein